jgi:polyhydroxyalkanoate synthesis regulator phasin
MAAKKQPAITGLHSQGIADDIIKIGVKGVKRAVSATVKNKRYVAKKVKADYPTARQMVKSGKMTPSQAKAYKTSDVKTFRNEIKKKYKTQGSTTFKGRVNYIAKEKGK